MLVSFNNNTTGGYMWSGAGTTSPHGAPEFTSGLSGVRVLDL